MLNIHFFKQPTLDICPQLLGKYLIHHDAGNKYEGFITEVEAYVGREDKACHATKGKTERNKPMFEAGGTWYVYLVYGMYWMLNIVTEEKDFPAAILIRGIKTKENHLNGPGKLTKAFHINKKFNGKLAIPEQGLWLEDRGIEIPPQNINTGKRIGINYAGIWKHKPWRFYLKSF